MHLTPHTARRLVASLLASLAVLVVAAPASAVRDETLGSGDFAAYAADSIGIPNSVASAVEANREPAVVVPYVSQGLGVTRMDPALLYAHEPEYIVPSIGANDRAHNQLGGSDDTPFRLHSDRTESSRVGGLTGGSSGTDWETAGVAAGIAGFTALLAGSAMLAFRRQRRLESA